MIEIVDIRYCRLGTPDLESTVDFARNLIGLEEVDRQDRQVYLRGDHRDHNICYFEGSPSDHTFGLELESFAALEAARKSVV